jgi:hypothetical protein
MRLLQVIAIVGVSISVSACSTGLTQMQDTAAKFDQGAHSASTAQMSLFHQVQEAECRGNFYAQAFSFATRQEDPRTHQPISLDLAPSCNPEELTDAQLEIRQKLMDTITLYADAIQTLANGTDSTNLRENSQSLASNIQGLAKQQGFTFTNVTATDTAALNAAVVTITSLILDRTKYREVKEAAASVQPQLTTIVAQLKAENLIDAEGLASKSGSVTNEFYTALLSARDQRGPASFLDIVQAHIALQSIVTAPPNVAQLNDTLDALVAANHALASATNGAALAEVSDLVSRAQQAVILYNSSK